MENLNINNPITICDALHEFNNEMENLKEIYKCINALDTKAARYLDPDGITDLQILMDCIESLEYHKEELDSAIETIKNRIEELNEEDENIPDGLRQLNEWGEQSI